MNNTTKAFLPFVYLLMKNQLTKNLKVSHSILFNFVFKLVVEGGINFTLFALYPENGFQSLFNKYSDQTPINPNRFTWSLFCPWHDFVIFITHR